MFNFERYKFETLGYTVIPKFLPLKEELNQLGLPLTCESEEYLKRIVNVKYKEKLEKGLIPKAESGKYKERIQHEMDEIKKLGFIDYFILIYRICEFADRKGILRGPGRGSAAGSQILWTLGVTRPDPLRHDLLFERFISAARTETKEINGRIYIASSSLPDVDLDFQGLRKHEINDFLNSEFNNQTVAVANLSTFQSKAIIKEVLKIYHNFSEDDSKVVADLIDVKFGNVQPIAEALKENKEFIKWAESYPDAVHLAAALSELIKNKSIHASGILICDGKVDEILPLELGKKKGEETKKIVCGFDKYTAEKLGIKVDNLGLKSLDLLKECLDLVGKSFDDIDVNHKSIYDFINYNDHFYGIFQAEDGLGKMTLKKIIPSNIEDISVSVALGRPGAMRFINEYSQVKKGDIKKEVHPSLASILKPTQGFIVFQEQIMKLSQKMADFTPKEADGLRKGIGKKIKEKVLEYKEKFIANSLKNGYSKELVDDIWKSFEDSADYSFNKSHAVSYGYLTAYTAYLKANHPLEFFIACLNQAENESKPLEEISKIKAELSSFNIKLLPPSLKNSNEKFTIENGGIRFPLSNIKGINKKTCEKLIALKGDFKNRVDIFKAATVAGINKTTLFGLIMAGALDDFISSQRVLVMAEAAFWKCLTDREQDKILELAKDNNESIFDLFKKMKVLVNEKAKPFINERRLNTINKNFDPYKKMYNQNKIDQDITKFYFETKLLGFAYTKSLQEIYNQKGAQLDSITDIRQGVEEESFRFIGIVTEKKTGITKAGNDYLKLTIEGHDGTFGAMLFNSKNNKKIDQHEEINGRIAEEDDVVIVSGKKKGDVLFADNIGIQKIEVYEKLKDIISNEKNEENTQE